MILMLAATTTVLGRGGRSILRRLATITGGQLFDAPSQWALFVKDHCGDWHGHWTSYELRQDGQGLAEPSVQRVKTSFALSSDGTEAHHVNTYWAPEAADEDATEKDFGAVSASSLKATFVPGGFHWCGTAPVPGDEGGWTLLAEVGIRHGDERRRAVFVHAAEDGRSRRLSKVILIEERLGSFAPRAAGAPPPPPPAAAKAGSRLLREAGAADFAATLGGGVTVAVDRAAEPGGDVDLRIEWLLGAEGEEGTRGARRLLGTVRMAGVGDVTTPLEATMELSSALLA